MAVNSGNILRPGRVVHITHERIRGGVLVEDSWEGEVVTTDALGIWLKLSQDEETMIPWGRVIEIGKDRKSV